MDVGGKERIEAGAVLEAKLIVGGNVVEAAVSVVLVDALKGVVVVEITEDKAEGAETEDDGVVERDRGASVSGSEAENVGANETVVEVGKEKAETG